MEELVRLSPLESAIDIPVGEHPSAPTLPESDSAVSPLAALERALLAALERPPCLVLFSGGRDSSTLLAIAVRLARTVGLPLPIATTRFFPGRPASDESRWQELVVRHLNLPDWHRCAFADELDLIGPLAQTVLRRHGLVSPSTAFDLLASLQDTGGGTLVTGMEGDDLFGGWSSWRPWSALRGQVRPEPRDALRIAKLVAPGALRRAWVRHRHPLEPTWLLPEPKAELEHAWRSWWAGEPLVWNRRIVWWARTRVVASRRQALDLMAEGTGARVVHPFLDPSFLAALAKAGGWSGFGDRTATMRTLFGDLLPREVLARTDKADFTAVFWTEQSKQFASRWTGAGVPLDIVDPEALRATWTAESPDARSSLLLQAAWLATSGGRQIPENFNCDLE